MREALKKAGLSQAEAARRLGYKQSTFNRWMTGARRPDDKEIAAFAQLTGASEDALIHGAATKFREWAIRFADLVHAGTDPARGIDEVTAGADETGGLGDAERESLSQAAEGMRTMLREQAGGAWDRLTADQKWQVLQQIEALAQQNERFRQQLESPKGHSDNE
jgi:transcriptional regulator with XRE-family HTH domain